MFSEKAINFDDLKRERNLNLFLGVLCFLLFAFSMFLYTNLQQISFLTKVLRYLFYITLFLTVYSTVLLAKKQNRSTVFWGISSLIMPLSAVVLSFLGSKYETTQTTIPFKSTQFSYRNTKKENKSFNPINQTPFEIEITKVAQHASQQIIIHGLLKEGEFPKSGYKFAIKQTGECAIIDDVVNLNEILAKQAKLLGNENHISTPHLAITTSNLNINQVSVGDRIISKT